MVAMATRLQIARARVQVALARRTGEEVPQGIIELSQADLSTAEKPPRAWEKPAAEPILDGATPESGETTDASADAPPAGRSFNPSDVHDRWAENVARGAASTNRTVNEILERSTRGTVECYLVTERSAFGEEVLRERLTRIWEKLPRHVAGATLVGDVDLWSKQGHRPGRHLYYGEPLDLRAHDADLPTDAHRDLGIVVLRSDDDGLHDDDADSAGSSARSGSASSQR